MKNIRIEWSKLKIKHFYVCFYILLIWTNYSYSQSDIDIVGKKSGNKWAFFDKKGKALTQFIFDDIHPANICSYKPNLWFGEDLRWFYKGLSVVEYDNQFAVLNEKMEYVVTWKTYQWISPISIGGLMIVKKNNKYGLLNHQLELVQLIEFDTISNSPAQRQEQNYPSFWAKKNDKYYIFDTLGYWKDGINYDNIQLLQANFYLVTNNGISWRVDRNGIRINEDYTFVREDENGFVAKKDSKFGLVDNNGEIILPFEYENIIGEHLGNIFVKKNGKWGVVNEENQQLLPCNYDYIAYAWDDIDDERNYIVVQNDKFGKVTENGNKIFSCLYDGITTWVEYGPDGHYVMLGDKMGLIDYKGKIIIPIKFDKVECIHGTNWAIIYDKDKVGLYSLVNNSFFLPLEYDYLYVDRHLFDFKNSKPTQIITYKNGIVNILDKNGQIVKSNVSKTVIKKDFELDIEAYKFFPCSYELLLMLHNKTFQIPDCLLQTLKEYNTPIESIYYKMEKI
jgi:hypothetical protein